MKEFLFIYITIIVFHSISFSQNSKIDSLITELSTTKIDSVKIRLNLEIGKKLSRTSVALQYLKKGLNISKKNKDYYAMVKFYNELGNNYLYSADYDKATDCFFKSLEINEKIDNQAGKAKVFNYLCMLNGDMGNFDESLKHAKKALKISLKINNQKRAASVYNNMGLIYDRINKEDSSIICYKKCLIISEKIKDVRAYAMSNNNISSIYLKQKKYKQALESCQKAYDFALENNYRELLPLFKMNISGIYLNMAISTKNKSKQEKTINEALIHAKIALRISKEFENLRDIASVYLLTSEIYEIAGNYKSALNYLDSSIIISDRMNNKDKINSAKEIEAKFQTEKKQIEIEKQQILLRQQAYKVKILYFSITIILLFFAILTHLIISKIKFRNKAARVLLKEKITKQKAEQTNLALHIVQKNDLLNEISDKLKALGRKLKINNADKDIQNLYQDIKIKINIDKERAQFQENIYIHMKDFFDKLKTEYSELSEKERNVAAMVRLNFSSKDISTLMNVAPKTIVTYRYRIRKKMNLENDTNFVKFLNSL